MSKEFVMGARLTLKDMLSKPFAGAAKVSEDFSKKASKADKAVKSLGITSKNTAKVSEDFSKKASKADKAVKSLGITSKNTKKFVDNLTKAGKKAGGILGKILPSSFTIAAGAAATGYVAFNSLKKAMDFEAQMSSIKALTGATKQEMAQMQGLALKMGAATKYNALEAAQAIEELLKAGVTPAQVQAGALEAALNLATAGGLDLAAAAETMSTSLNAFKKDGMTAAQAANILAGTANASATGVDKLRESLNMVAPVATGIGMSFKDTNVALGLFANNGLKGSDAGTSLKTMLMNLQPTTERQIKLMQQLGLMSGKQNAFFTAEGNLKSLAEIADVTQNSFKDLSNQQRQLAFEILFGTDAIRAANMIYTEGAKGVKNFEAAISNVTALDVAREKMNNAAGAVEEFSGAMETLQIAGLIPTMPLIRSAALAAADFVQKYTPQIQATMERGVDRVKKYIKKHFTDNKDFKKLTVSGKIGFVVDDVLKTFNEWYDKKGGSDKVAAFGKKAGNAFADGLEAAAPRLGEAALTIGKATGQAMLSAFNEALKNSPLGAIVAGATGGAAVGSVVPGVGTAAGAAAGAAAGLASHALGGYGSVGGTNIPNPPTGHIDVRTGKPTIGTKPTLPGHAAGLNTVPYDNYLMRAHEGEAVLNKREAKEWRGTVKQSGAASRVIQIDKLVEKVILQSNGTAKDLESQADKFLAIVYDKLKAADEILSNGDKGALVL